MDKDQKSLCSRTVNGEKKRSGVNALKNNHIDLNGLDRQD